MELTLTELTRRQMRELERNGSAVSTSVMEEKASPVLDSPKAVISSDYQAPPLTRRQLREQDRRSTESKLDSEPKPQAAPVADVSNVWLSQVEVTEVISPSSEQLPKGEGRVRPRPAPLPPIGERRELRQAVNEIEHEKPSEISSLDAEIPEQGFRGANYLGEPSTQSIMLEVAPEAISMPLDTGEVFSTGSISILSEPTGSITGSLDGIDLDSDEAVTGVISIVDPVSARDLIDERSPLGVVPSGVLLKGWWRPWVVGAFSLALAIAAILASITIFNALGA
jgi:hypothetical protein